MVPTVRLALAIVVENRTGVPESSASRLITISCWSSALSRPWSWRELQYRSWFMNADSGSCRTGDEVQLVRLPMRGGLRGVQRADLADHLVDRAEAQLRHQLADFFGDEHEEVLHELRLAVEPLPQHRVLGGHAHRAGVEVADPHHDAARHHQRRGGETELLGAEQRGDHHVAAGLELAVDLDHDAVAKTVEQQGLLGLGQAQLPRRAGMLHRRQRGGAGAAVVTGDQHHVGVRLGHAGRDRADPVLARPASRAPGPAGWRSSGRGSAAPDPRSSRCRGAAAVRSGRHPVSSAGPRPPTGTPCGPEAGRPHRVSRPAPS